MQQLRTSSSNWSGTVLGTVHINFSVKHDEYTWCVVFDDNPFYHSCLWCCMMIIYLVRGREASWLSVLQSIIDKMLSVITLFSPVQVYVCVPYRGVRAVALSVKRKDTRYNLMVHKCQLTFI